MKVVTNEQGRALYFSRAPIPYLRNEPGSIYKHLGIYGYRREFFGDVAQVETLKTGEMEALEQLRLLENGIPIQVVEVAQDSIGVDILEDLDRVRPLLENELKESKKR